MFKWLATVTALAAAVLLAACTTTSTVRARPALERGNAEATAPGPATAPHCGTERWPVKTGTDADASNVDLRTAVPQDITALAALKPPAVLPQNSRIPPAEDTVYQVQATLRAYKMEADSDYHLVLADAQGNTMIAEIPAPACVGPGSPFLAGITRARAAFDARYAPGGFWQPAGVPVVVTGVGFFDQLHGQTGVAPNGIELHPVLDIQFGQTGPAAAAAVPLTEQPPECVTVIVHAYQPDGTIRRVRLEFCGGSPGADSALHDWADGRRFTLDGALAIGDGCGGRADPCVIFPGP